MPSGIRLALLEIFFALPVVAEEIAKLLTGIDSFVVIIAQGNDGSILIHHPDKNGSVAMPPSVMIDQFLAIGYDQHTPSQAIIPFARLFETIGGIGAVHDVLGKIQTGTQRLIPFVQITHRAEDILIAIDQVEEFHAVTRA